MPLTLTVTLPLEGRPREMPYPVTRASAVPWGQRPDTRRRRSPSPTEPSSASPSTLTLRSPTVVRTGNVLSGDTGAPTSAETASALSTTDPSGEYPGMALAEPEQNGPRVGVATLEDLAGIGPSTRA